MRDHLSRMKHLPPIMDELNANANSENLLRRLRKSHCSEPPEIHRMSLVHRYLQRNCIKKTGRTSQAKMRSGRDLYRDAVLSASCSRISQNDGECRETMI